jgi:hypothetical protein
LSGFGMPARTPTPNAEREGAIFVSAATLPFLITRTRPTRDGDHIKRLSAVDALGTVGPDASALAIDVYVPARRAFPSMMASERRRLPHVALDSVQQRTVESANLTMRPKVLDHLPVKHRPFFDTGRG